MSKRFVYFCPTLCHIVAYLIASHFKRKMVKMLLHSILEDTVFVVAVVDPLAHGHVYWHVEYLAYVVITLLSHIVILIVVMSVCGDA